MTTKYRGSCRARRKQSQSFDRFCSSIEVLQLPDNKNDWIFSALTGFAIKCGTVERMLFLLLSARRQKSRLDFTNYAKVPYHLTATTSQSTYSTRSHLPEFPSIHPRLLYLIPANYQFAQGPEEQGQQVDSTSRSSTMADTMTAWSTCTSNVVHWSAIESLLVLNVFFLSHL